MSDELGLGLFEGASARMEAANRREDQSHVLISSGWTDRWSLFICVLNHPFPLDLTSSGFAVLRLFFFFFKAGEARLWERGPKSPCSYRRRPGFAGPKRGIMIHGTWYQYILGGKCTKRGLGLVERLLLNKKIFSPPSVKFPFVLVPFSREQNPFSLQL